MPAPLPVKSNPLRTGDTGKYGREGRGLAPVREEPTSERAAKRADELRALGRGAEDLKRKDRAKELLDSLQKQRESTNSAIASLGASRAAASTAMMSASMAQTAINAANAMADGIANSRGAFSGSPGEPASNKFLRVAKSQLGVPYVWGAINPEGNKGGAGEGFDCSGYTSWVMKRVYGVNLPHMASIQQQQTQAVSRKGLTAGDLLFYNYGRKAAGVADHVMIYIGNGKCIGASSGAGKVTIQSVDWANFIGGGRVRH